MDMVKYAYQSGVEWFEKNAVSRHFIERGLLGGLASRASLSAAEKKQLMPRIKKHLQELRSPDGESLPWRLSSGKKDLQMVVQGVNRATRSNPQLSERMLKSRLGAS